MYILYVHFLKVTHGEIHQLSRYRYRAKGMGKERGSADKGGPKMLLLMAYVEIVIILGQQTKGMRAYLDSET